MARHELAGDALDRENVEAVVLVAYLDARALLVEALDRKSKIGPFETEGARPGWVLDLDARDRRFHR